ncbi:hypothetical protein [Flavobacterium sp.]|uniref:hypothetical protein n=1 Tax=Flavobacterium sp. TaxID=239 RepID=UPI00391CCBB8
MKYILKFTFLILIGCGNSADKNELNKSLVVTDKDIYEVVNFVLNEQDKDWANTGIKNNPYKYIIDKDSEIHFEECELTNAKKIDTIFTKEDLKFIQQQIQNRKDFKFKGKFIKSKKVISANVIQEIFREIEYNPKKDFYEIYKKEFGNDLYSSIGLPVFSKDKKTVYVKVERLMFGGFSAIYKKENDKWKFHCYLCAWS